jgi:hypothetical protein
MLGRSASVIVFAYYISEAISCSGNNDVDHISAEVLKSLERRIKISGNIHFPVEFQVVCNIILFIF